MVDEQSKDTELYTKENLLRGNMDNKKLSDKTRKEIKQLKADLKSRDERYAKNLREIEND